MVNANTEEALQTLHIQKDIEIAAPPAIVFEAVLAELGPENEMPDGTPFPFKLEAWPGGRWYRDLGNDAGHLWGHVQVIKPPSLIELCGPMFMSYPATNHIQYRLTPAGDGTKLLINHRAIGLFPPEVPEGAGLGWEHGLRRIRQIAERLTTQRSNQAQAN
jgi:uncharacterized protein YndB with AHSA1/START domain